MHSVKVLRTTVGYSLTVMITDLCRHRIMIRGEHGIQCKSCFPRIIREMLPKINAMGKIIFLKSIIHSQIIAFSVIYLYDLADFFLVITLVLCIFYKSRE